MFKIYSEDKTSHRPDIFFRLEERNNGIALTACNEDGQRMMEGYVLEINEKGYLVKFASVNEETGLSLDRSGRITESSY